MKKVLWLIVCLMTMVLSVNAQNKKWVSMSHDADELTETEAYTSLIYTDAKGSVVLWDNDNEKFRIAANGVFDSKVDTNGWSMKKRSMFKAIIGYYNVDDKLISKKKCYFEIGANHSQAHNIKYQFNREEGKYIISYLRNEKGYVRIIAPLYNTNETFDIKVPCIKNE